MNDADLRYALINFLEWEDNHGELMYSRNFKKSMSGIFNRVILSIAKLGTKVKSDEEGFDVGYSYKGYTFTKTKGKDGFWVVEDDKTVLFESV